MERLFMSRQSRHFDFDVVIYKVFFPICTLTWRVNNYVFRQGKGISRRKYRWTEFCYLPVVLMIVPSIVTSIIKKTVKQQFEFSSAKARFFKFFDY